MNILDMIAASGKKRRGWTGVYVFIGCFLFAHPAFAEPGDHEGPGGSGYGQRQGTGGGGARSNPRAGCKVSPFELNEFANGDTYHYGAMVDFLNNPSCERMGPPLSQRAIGIGVSWINQAPWRLDMFALPTLKGDLKGRDLMDARLSDRTPTILRQNPVGSDELLPLIGQLALLSPTAARTGMVELAKQQLFTADELLNMPNTNPKANASRVAQAVIRLGLDKGKTARAFGNTIEEMALLAQADSLNKIFRTLGAAAQVEGSLVPTFNVSTSALNRGIQKGYKLLSERKKSDLMKTVYIAIQSANGGNEQFEPSMAELNEAMLPLMNGYPLLGTNLKQTWKTTLGLLSDNASQTVLADAVGNSITPQVIFLSPAARIELLMAARNYRQISVAIQKNVVLGWNKMRANRQKKTLGKSRFKRLRKRNIEPWVSDLLELDPSHITRSFMVAIVESNLVRDSNLEKRFPLFVVAHLEGVGQAAATPIDGNDMAATAAAMAQNFSALWTLSSIHVPALWEWVERYDESEEEQVIEEQQQAEMANAQAEGSVTVSIGEDEVAAASVGGL